ncbi:calumenin-A [Vitis riparia]|uniref:calumenin-A n=1 Tax=Vitis riparia TaxID=96939 RepID=UPI00155AB16C|nr:calumenin-A [Vitis riparia]
MVSGLLTIAFVFFVVFTPTTQKGHNNFYLARRLGHNRVAFNPLVEEIEEKARETSDHHFFFNLSNIFLNDVEDKYEFVSQVKNLNITMRLMVLFPLLDVEPRDGFISLKELEHWNMQQAIHRLSYRTHKELVLFDQNEDGAITFREYLPKISYQSIENNGMTHGEAGWWEDQFKNADFDNNGALGFEEFKDFLYPKDSENATIQKWISREKIKQFDHDNDGKLSYIEFQEQPFNLYKTYVGFENSGLVAAEPKEKFAELDANKDRYLNEEEMKPILHYLHPGESAYAGFYSKYLIHEADENKDGRLSLQEMINNENLFYNIVYEGTDDDLHHEF